MNIEDVVALIKNEPNDITFYAGASLGEIEDFERHIQLKLPDDIKTFYQFSNGFESSEDLFRIIPLNEIIGGLLRFSGSLGANQFYLAEYLVYCDMWRIEIDSTKLNTYTIFGGTGDKPETALTHSFTDFISCFLAGGVFNDNGLYKWREEIDRRSV